MQNHQTFSFFIANIISNTYFHCFLIIFEYICFIFPSCYNSSLKLRYYGESTKVFISSTPQVNYLFLLTYFHEAQSVLFSIIVFSIVFVMLISYYIIILFGIPKGYYIRFPLAVLINMIDLILFRYLSIYAMDSFAWLAHDFHRFGTLISDLISIIFFLLFLFYILTAYKYIGGNLVIISVTNPSIVNKAKEYPYDNISSTYQMQLVMIQAAVILEYNYFNAINTIDAICIALNVCIILLSISLFYNYSLLNIYIRFRCSLFYANIRKNYLRNTITLFNFFIIILNFFLFIPNLWGTLFIAVNFTLVLSYFEYKYLFNWILLNQTISAEFIMLYLIKNTSKDSFMFKYHQMIDTVHMNHTANCKLKDCIICQNYCKDINEKVRLFYKYYKHHGKKTGSLYDDLIKFIFYKTNKKSIKFLYFYYNLLNKYSKTDDIAVKTIKTLVDNWLEKEENVSKPAINNICKARTVEIELEDLLSQIQILCKEQVKFIRPETVMELANKTYNIIDLFKDVNKTNNVNHVEMIQSMEERKILNESFTYTMHLLRFIIEHLINQDMLRMPYVDIENLDEFLNLHFNSDRLFITAINLKEFNYQRNKVNIVKVNGYLSKNGTVNKTLSDYIPKELYQIGIDSFNKSNKTKSDEKQFIFPFLVKEQLFYLNYHFKIIETINNDAIILYGNYSKKKNSCILLNMNGGHTMEIVYFCSDLLKLLQLKKKWIHYLKSIQHEFYLQTLFKCIRESQDKTNIELEFDYEFYIEHLGEAISELKNMPVTKQNNKPDELMSHEKSLDILIGTLKEKIGYSIIIVLKQVHQFENGYVIYSCNFKNKFNNSVYAHNKNNTDINQIQEDNLFNNIVVNTLQSSTSSQNSTTKSKIIIKNSTSNQYHLLNPDLEQQIIKPRKKIVFFAIIMISINVILLINCIAFLFAQINQSENLIVLFDIFFKFKSIKIFLSNIIINLVTTVCFAHYTETNYCSSAYLDFSWYFINKYELDEKFNLQFYALKELKLKTDFIQTTLITFREFLYHYKEKEIGKLLEKEMILYEFDQSSSIDNSKQLRLIMVNKTFEEGILEYLSTMFVLSDSDIDFSTIPLYFLSFSNGEFSFKYVPEQTLNEIQKNLYKGLFNYFNFYNAFQDGQNKLSTETDMTSKANEQSTECFMIILAALNFLLGIICIFYMYSSYNLFKILITYVVKKINKSDSLNALITKVDQLKILVKLYTKNPNDIIKNLLKNNKIMPIDKEKDKEKTINNEKNTCLSNEEINLHFELDFYNSILGTVTKLLPALFIVYFLIIIIFDIILTSTFTKLNEVFKYTLIHFNYEDTIYSNLVFTVLMFSGNISSHELNFLLKRNDTINGVNDLFRESFILLKSMATYQQSDGDIFLQMTNFFNYSCDELFFGFNDSFTNDISVEKGLDFRLISKAVCKEYDLLTLNNFFFMRSDMIDRTQRMANKYKGRDYNDLMAFDNDHELYEILTISIFAYRPLSFYFRLSILLPHMNNIYKNYIVLVGIYLALNILLEFIMFILVKFIVINRLHLIQEKLYLFNNCIIHK